MQNEFDIGLSKAEIERLVLLAEECSEVVQAVMKILRHGYASVNPKASHSALNNRVRLQIELGHVLYALELMKGADDIDENVMQNSLIAKEKEIKKYLHYN